MPQSKKIKTLLFFACFLAFANFASASTTLKIEGAELTENLNNSFIDNFGLEFTALKDVTLESFTFENQGKPDKIWLKNNSSDTLLSYDYIGGESSHQVIANWSLEKDNTYSLYSESGTNGRWASYSSFPFGNDHIRVNGSHVNNSLKSKNWYNFTDLTTTATAPSIETPLPAAIWFFGSGLMFLEFNRRKRKASALN